MRGDVLPGEILIRRRGSLAQGQALEILGHSVEYLMDSRIFLRDGRAEQDEQEAIQILMRLSRTVFLECPEVVPVSRRLGRWLTERVAGTVRQRA